MTLTLRSLLQVRAVATLKHFGRAAESLSMSQPALSRSIQNLEDSLGVLLFDRNRKSGVEITEFGELVLERGDQLLKEADELIREIQLRKGLKVGTLRIETALYPNEFLVSRAVGRLLRRHPDLHCSIHMTNWWEAADRVLNRECDIAVIDISEARKNPRLDCRLLGRYPIRFACRPGHPLLETEGITAEVFYSYPIAGTLGHIKMAEQMPNRLGRAGSIDSATGYFVPAVLVTDLWGAVQVVLESDCLTAIPHGPRIPAHYTGMLRELDFRPPWMVLETGIVTLRNRTPSAATLALIEVLELLAAELAD